MLTHNLTSRLHIIHDNTTGNFIAPADKNIMYYNAFKKANIDDVFRSFSLKFVLKGNAYYKIDSGTYKVQSNSVLVAPAQPGTVYFNEEEEVIVLCISINDAIIAEAFNLAKGSFSFDNFLDGYFKFPCFMEGLYMNNEVTYLPALQSLTNAIYNASLPFITDEWFYDISEKIVSDELKNIRSLSGMSPAKLSTRKELLRRLNIAKQYMDDNYLEVPAIGAIAKVSTLSQFHFFRSFKEVFSITPFKYMQDKRLEHAKKLLLQRDHKIGDIAIECSFPDAFTFSKAFKKKYGLPPSYYNKYTP
ncbi:MAG: AraC family transcriptional regulator [Ginsengibacter sp.]